MSEYPANFPKVFTPGAVPIGNVQFCDVSEYQGVIDWDKYPFAMAVIRAGYGNTYQDAQFKRNWQEAKARGILRCAYWFHVPGKSPQKHRDSFLSALGDDPGEYPPVWDEEYLGDLTSLMPSLASNFAFQSLTNAQFVLGSFYDVPAPSLLQRIRLALPSGLKQDLYNEVYKLTHGIYDALGNFPLIYTSYNFWTSYMPVSDIERDCDLYIANWKVSSPRIPQGWINRNKTWRWWQKDVLKGKGPEWGMQSKDIDWDENNGDWAELLRYGKLDPNWVPWPHTEPPPPPPPPPPVNTYQVQVKSTATPYLNYRADPNVSGADLGNLMPGTTVTVDGENGDWLHIKDGWLHKNYVNKIS